MDSPLLFPVRMVDGKIIVLDETKLPFHEEYIEINEFCDVLEALKTMKTRALGQVLLFFYSCVKFKDELCIDDIVAEFIKQRPTFDFPMLGKIIKMRMNNNMGIAQVVEEFISEFDRLRRRRSRRLAELLPSPAKILTLCNVNGELIYLYESLKEQNKGAVFYICETRPYLQGTRLTFWELRKNGIPVKLVCDNQAAEMMKTKTVNCIVTGADRATTKEDIINKLGTYALACLGKYFNIPFYALTQYPQDVDIANIEIEERDSSEVFMFLNGDFSTIDALYPSFDVVPSKFITANINLTD